MARLIKRFHDGSLLEYGRGAFDDWCIYLTQPAILRYAPKDVDYFVDVARYAQRHSSLIVYRHFIAVYERTDQAIQKPVLELIEQLSKNYGLDAGAVEITFTILYAGMVAEQNKKHTRLGKRVKRLGVHQILMENMSPEQAAHFSKGKSWHAIAAECQKRGF